MSTNNADIYIGFHNQANQTFFLLEKVFLSSIEKVNRHEEEFRFQQMKKEYASKLKHELELSAQELMQRRGLHPATGHDFNDFINEYVHRFVQKIDTY